MEYNENKELNLLKEFYEQYKHTQQDYIRLTNIKKTFERQLYDIEHVIKENRRFGIWAIIVGVVTIPIFIGVFIVVFGIIALIIAAIQDRYKDKRKQRCISEFTELINRELGYLNQQYKNTNMCIAFDYASPFIVTKLIQYMEYGRADTLKEALNIYENELAINLQQQQLQEIARASKKVATATTYMAYDTYVKNIVKSYR